ncbi:MAG: RimK/LysX family protein [Pseudomonadota bacterium]
MFRLVLIATALVGISSLTMAQETNVRGWIEHVRIMPDGLLMSAKLDSGAQTTSIHAEILAAGHADEADPEQGIAGQLADTEDDASAMLSIKMMEGDAPDDPPALEVVPIAVFADGEDRPDTVTFRLTSRGGKSIVYTAPVERWVSIRRRGGGSIVRPVVMMDLCVGGIRVSGEVNLADRSGFNYPILIGRNMLSDARISVDSRQIFASKRACPPEE